MIAMNHFCKCKKLMSKRLHLICIAHKLDFHFKMVGIECLYLSNGIFLTLIYFQVWLDDLPSCFLVSSLSDTGLCFKYFHVFLVVADYFW
jgi:hypothetical protein